MEVPPVRDPETSLTPGNLITPTILEDEQSGPQIVRAMMEASENTGLIPEAAEGPLFLEYGDFETGGADLSGAPTNYPMSMMDMISLLTSTGRLDVVVEPIDSGGNMGRLSAYNGRYGTDRRDSVIFSYGMDDYNVRGMQWNQDMSNVVNKLQYFFTPRETTERYKANITGDDPCLYYGGGDLGAGGSIRACLQGSSNPLGALRLQSQADYGVRYEAQEFDIGELAIEDHSPCTGAPGDDPCDLHLCDARSQARALALAVAGGVDTPREAARHVPHQPDPGLRDQLLRHRRPHHRAGGAPDLWWLLTRRSRLRVHGLVDARWALRALGHRHVALAGGVLVTRSLYEPTLWRATAKNRFGVKSLKQKPLAMRWWEPGCTPGGGGGCSGDEPPLLNGWAQPANPLEKLRFPPARRRLLGIQGAPRFLGSSLGHRRRHAAWCGRRRDRLSARA